MRRAALLALACLAAATPARALYDWQGETWSLGLDGAGRSFTFVTRGDAAERQAVSTQRLRLDATLRLGGGARVDAAGDFTAVLGTGGATAFALPSATDWRWRDLDATVERGDGYSLLRDLDRLALSVRRADMTLCAGRQAVTLGNALLLPSLDLFAPFTPGALDTEYKRGVDALRLGRAFGLRGEAELIAVAHADSLDAGALLARGRLDLGGVSATLLGGVGMHEPFAGVSLSTDLGGTGYYAEGLARAGRHRDDTWRLTVGAQRQLLADLSAALEFQHDSFGATSVDGYLAAAQVPEIRRGEAFLLGRDYLALNLNWQARPLLALSLFALRNLHDASMLLEPALNWDFAQEAAIGAGGLYGLGKGTHPGPFGIAVPRSEFGTLPDTVFAELRFYF
ncbi:MAG: hypothetical protein H6693_04830 [Candidatus Latescibacteria bacterium]|nr:hypothetical protein [Candidatus Latescibacterota bacterium]